jgi:hypothetical protein
MSRVRYLETQGTQTQVLSLSLTKQGNIALTIIISNPPHSMSFMSTITNTSGRLHSEFVYLLFLIQSKVGITLSKVTDTYHFKVTHSSITLANLSSINLVSMFRCSSPPCNPVYVRRVDPLTLVFSLSSHRHSYIGLFLSSHFIDS